MKKPISMRVFLPKGRQFLINRKPKEFSKFAS